MYLKSSNNSHSSSGKTTSNSANRTIEAVDNHGNVSFVNDTDNVNRNHLTAIQLRVIQIMGKIELLMVVLIMSIVK